MELRRLQIFLDEERDQQRFSHAIDLRCDDRPPVRPRERRPSVKQVDSKVERLLDKVGLSHRKPATRPGPRSEPLQRQSVRQDAKVVLHPASERAWHAHIHHAPALAPISSEDRIGSTAPVKGRSPAPSAFAAGHGFVRSHLTWERLRTGYAFLVGRAPAIGWMDRKLHSPKG